MRRAEIKRKFDEIVAFAGVDEFVDTPVKRYSSGMHVRLAFAVAAHLETEILLVDEVLAVGDAAFQKRCLGKMGDVAREGRTILFVSHNMATVEALCQSCLYIAGGRLVAQGSPGEAIRRYMAEAWSRRGQPRFAQPCGTPERIGSGHVVDRPLLGRSRSHRNCQDGRAMSLPRELLLDARLPAGPGSRDQDCSRRTDFQCERSLRAPTGGMHPGGAGYDRMRD